MSLLPAIFPNPRDVSFYVAGIQIRLVERWVQELDQRIIPVNKAFIHSFHCHARAFGTPGTGENRPALRNGINLTFGITRRTERRAVIKICAAVPLTIPAILFDIQLQLSSLHPAAFDEGESTTHARTL